MIQGFKDGVFKSNFSIHVYMSVFALNILSVFIVLIARSMYQSIAMILIADGHY